ncbi:MAG: GNAT family N-acetyltransferase [Halolamina sp.]|uniref:GNAT family N-acetyltransferase n=1 Tax=Halolamina sp. TaxID=1940283 RepID=UPI002FC35E27
MELRTASRSDLPAIREVAEASLAASYDDILGETVRERALESWYGEGQSLSVGEAEVGAGGGLAETIDDEENAVVVAEEDGEIVGFSQASIVEGPDTVGRIEWIHVDPDHRGSGVGSRLLDRIEAELASAGASRIEGRVLEANQEGKTFYKQRGYKQGATRELRLGSDWVTERSFVREYEEPTTTGINEQRETESGETVIIAYDDSARGSKGPFYGAYLDPERETRYGWYCGVCDSLDVNMDAMGRLECDNCGNRRKATRWDATSG